MQCFVLFWKACVSLLNCIYRSSVIYNVSYEILVARLLSSRLGYQFCITYFITVYIFKQPSLVQLDCRKFNAKCSLRGRMYNSRLPSHYQWSLKLLQGFAAQTTLPFWYFFLFFPPRWCIKPIVIQLPFTTVTIKVMQHQ